MAKRKSISESNPDLFAKTAEADQDEASKEAAKEADKGAEEEPVAEAEAAAVAGEKAVAEEKTAQGEAEQASGGDPEAVPKKTATFYLPIETLDRLEAAYYRLGVEGKPMTKSAIVDAALEQWLRKRPQAG